jgi:hypothetical protein
MNPATPRTPPKNIAAARDRVAPLASRHSEARRRHPDRLIDPEVDQTRNEQVPDRVGLRVAVHEHDGSRGPQRHAGAI